MLLRWCRHRLTALTTIWLFCQVLSLSALAPRYCCPAHGHDGESEAAGHHGGADAHCQLTANVEDTCPMAGVNGEACPMHRGTQSPSAAPGAHAGHGGHVAQASAAAPAVGPEVAAVSAGDLDADDCVMRATCAGPVTALASLIWIPGVLDDAQSAAIEEVATLIPSAPDSARSCVRPIDLPPPRI